MFPELLVLAVVETVPVGKRQRIDHGHRVMDRRCTDDHRPPMPVDTRIREKVEGGKAGRSTSCSPVIVAEPGDREIAFAPEDQIERTGKPLRVEGRERPAGDEKRVRKQFLQ